MMTRTEIELHGMKNGMTARQAERFASEVLAKNGVIRSKEQLNPMMQVFALGAGITLLSVALADDMLLNVPSAIVGGVADVGLGVAEVGLDILGGIFSIFD